MPIDMAVPNIDNAVKAGHVAVGHSCGCIIQTVGGAVICVPGHIAVHRQIFSAEVNVRQHRDASGEVGLGDGQDLNDPRDRLRNHWHLSITR